MLKPSRFAYVGAYRTVGDGRDLPLLVVNLVESEVGHVQHRRQRLPHLTERQSLRESMSPCVNNRFRTAQNEPTLIPSSLSPKPWAYVHNSSSFERVDLLTTSKIIGGDFYIAYQVGAVVYRHPSHEAPPPPSDFLKASRFRYSSADILNSPHHYSRRSNTPLD